MEKELKSLIKRIKEYNKDLNEERLIKAYNFAKEKYANQERLSGGTVLSHVVETAKILTTQKVDEDTIIAALMHELPSYTKVKSSDVAEVFGKDIGKLISAYEKMSVIREAKQNELETLRKLSLVMAKDLRVVLIKLADRLHNLQTLENLPSEDRKKIAQETMDIYVPIASRLGVYRIRSILEDLCFKYIKEYDYKSIQDQLKELGKKKKNVIDEITNIVQAYLSELGFEASVSGRLKNAFSIYKKLKKKGKGSIEEIHDIFAIRIILPAVFNQNGDENVSRLYELIGHIHNKWKPLPGRFKDYIGFPKPNGYKSLHTTVVGIAPHSFKEPVEIQLRSENMHDEAEYGVASHWLYKETKGKDINVQNQIEWIKNLAKISQENEMINEVKVDIFEDRIFILTPKGDVKDLPAGSTAIDFAYAIHSDVGNKCVMAKVNGKITPLDHELSNGDVVEILTKSNSKPKLEWLGFVKTTGAKNKIKAFYNSFDQDTHLKTGKDLINKKLEEIGKPQLDPKLTVLKNYSGRELNLKKREEMVRLVGSGTLLPSQVVWKIYNYNEVVGKKQRVKKGKKPAVNFTGNIENRITVGNEKGLPIRIAQCCKPKQGHAIRAYVTRGNALSIHREECRIFNMSDTDRHIEARWN